ncbi:MAG: hypothetical protein IKA32_02770 [Lentisphaeria bacterium]|nr:hypothetical protein [Lentisphaeria bacterium]
MSNIYKCEVCGTPGCKVEVSTFYDAPPKCLYQDQKPHCIADWREIENETLRAAAERSALPKQTAEVKRPEKKAKRPDWMKYEKWFFFRGKYAKLFFVSENQNIVSVDFLNGNRSMYPVREVYQEAVEARLRPYTADELRELVGKVIKTTIDVGFVVGYSYCRKKIMIGSRENYISAEALIEMDATIDGSPCGVLEHLNEAGEWVQ